MSRVVGRAGQGANPGEQRTMLEEFETTLSMRDDGPSSSVAFAAPREMTWTPGKQSPNTDVKQSQEEALGAELVSTIPAISRALLEIVAQAGHGITSSPASKLGEIHISCVFS